MNNDYAILFPGQGSQEIGMGKDLYLRDLKSREMMSNAEKCSGVPLSSYMFDGPQEALNRTNITQPCLHTTNASLYERFIRMGYPAPSYVAGHSAGEYTALYAAGVLTFEESLKLISKRGELMNTMQEGSMLAILNATDSEINNIFSEAAVTGGTLGAANWNSKNQTVISGDLNSIEKALDIALELELTAIPLPVSGAFHSPLMEPMLDKYEQFLKEVNFKQANIPVVANTTALPITSAKLWEETLLRQIISPVYWKQTIQFLYKQNIRLFVEIGPGNVLTKMLKRDYPDVHVYNIADVKSMNQFYTEAFKDVGII